MFKHILVPTDGSRFSEEAVRHAVAFAKENGARITAFFARPLTPVPSWKKFLLSNLSMEKSFEEAAGQEANDILSSVEKLCQEAGVSCTKLVLTNDIVYEAIIQAATQSACDMIFMASHGRHGIDALVLGSETVKVLTHSRVPVLVYR